MTGDGGFGCSQNLIVVSNHIVGRQPAVFLGQRHRSPSWMKSHAQVLCGLDLGGEQIASAVGVQVEVVGRRRATGERELGKTDPRRHVDRLGVDRPPERVQRLQPTEQRLVGHGRKRPGQVLVQVVVRVDETRGHQAIGRVDRGRCRRRRTGANVSDEIIGDRHPSTSQLTSISVDSRHTPSIRDHQVMLAASHGGGTQSGRSASSG